MFWDLTTNPGTKGTRRPRFQGWYAFVSLSTLLMSLTLVQVAMKAALHNGLPYPYTLTAPGWHCRLFSWGCDHIWPSFSWRFYVQKLGFKHQKWGIELSTMVEPWTIWILPRNIMVWCGNNQYTMICILLYIHIYTMSNGDTLEAKHKISMELCVYTHF